MSLAIDLQENTAYGRIIERLQSNSLAAYRLIRSRGFLCRHISGHGSGQQFRAVTWKIAYLQRNPHGSAWKDYQTAPKSGIRHLRPAATSACDGFESESN